MRDNQKVHPKIHEIIAQFEAGELHAARSGRMVMGALASVVLESPTTSVQTFAGDFEQNVDALLEAMPAYAPPFNVLHKLSSRLEQALELQESMIAFQSDVNEMADSYQQWSEQARSSIAAIGKTIIPEDGVVFTFTLSETVLRTLLETWESGRRFKVLVTESRPNNDGRVTAKSLADKGIEVAISIDACVNELIPQADLMIVGAEAILAEGSAICKVGTFPSALTAKQNQVPVYVLVDTMKFHVNSLLGKGASLDPIQAEDVVNSDFSGSSNIEGHLFDRTPPEYISGLVTEQGFVHPSQVSHWMLTMPISNSIVNRI